MRDSSHRCTITYFCFINYILLLSSPICNHHPEKIQSFDSSEIIPHNRANAYDVKRPTLTIGRRCVRSINKIDIGNFHLNRVQNTNWSVRQLELVESHDDNVIY